MENKIVDSLILKLKQKKNPGHFSSDSVFNLLNSVSVGHELPA